LYKLQLGDNQVTIRRHPSHDRNLSHKLSALGQSIHLAEHYWKNSGMDLAILRAFGALNACFLPFWRINEEGRRFSSMFGRKRITKPGISNRQKHPNFVPPLTASVERPIYP
jgi:hypothetical protein